MSFVKKALKGRSRSKTVSEGTKFTKLEHDNRDNRIERQSQIDINNIENIEHNDKEDEARGFLLEDDDMFDIADEAMGSGGALAKRKSNSGSKDKIKTRTRSSTVSGGSADISLENTQYEFQDGFVPLNESKSNASNASNGSDNGPRSRTSLRRPSVSSNSRRASLTMRTNFSDRHAVRYFGGYPDYEKQTSPASYRTLAQNLTLQQKEDDLILKKQGQSPRELKRLVFGTEL